MGEIEILAVIGDRPRPAAAAHAPQVLAADLRPGSQLPDGTVLTWVVHLTAVPGASSPHHPEELRAATIPAAFRATMRRAEHLRELHPTTPMGVVWSYDGDRGRWRDLYHRHHLRRFEPARVRSAPVWSL